MYLLSLGDERVLQEGLEVLVADKTSEPSDGCVVDLEPRSVAPGVEDFSPGWRGRACGACPALRPLDL